MVICNDKNRFLLFEMTENYRNSFDRFCTKHQHINTPFLIKNNYNKNNKK